MADIFNMADTWNSGGTTFTSIKMNTTDTASAAGSLLLDLQVGSVTKFSVSKGGNVSLVGSLGLTEMTAPSAPAANGTYVYTEDSGAGKTRLMVRFASGAAQMIATEV